jgi:glutamate-1-semialdehyde 2,1-aminomutase
MDILKKKKDRNGRKNQLEDTNLFIKEEIEQYKRNHPESEAMWKRSLKSLAGGVSHNIRNLGLPAIGLFPPFIQSGVEATVTDIDSIIYDDYWGSHYAMIAGYSNPRIKEKIESQVENGWHLGTVSNHQVFLAELLSSQNSSIDQVRFCTSGTEAAMYATRLARAFTGKKKVAKAKFGWHGAADTLFYNVRAPLTGKETRGIPNEEKAGILSIDINNPDVSSLIRKNAEDLAAIIVEPVLGGGGGFPVDPDFLRMLREETEQRDILLIFDEIITGYRFSNGLYQNDLNIYPDLTTMGKIIGGGFPIGAVGGAYDVIEQANPSIPDRVWIGGGTFSGYPLSMIAGCEMLSILKESSSDYDKINKMGTDLLNSLNTFFRENKLKFIATGHKSLITVHTLSKRIEGQNPIEIVEFSDKKKEALTQLSLLNRKITGMHGIGALCFAHQNKQIQYLKEIIEEVAPIISEANLDNF